MSDIGDDGCQQTKRRSIGERYIEYKLKTNKSLREFLDENPDIFESFNVQKHQIEPYLEKYVDYMINQRSEITKTERADLLNYQEWLMSEYLHETLSKKWSEENLEPLSGQKKLDFLEDLKKNLVEFLCFDECDDKKRWICLERLHVICNIPEETHQNWLLPVKKS